MKAKLIKALKWSHMMLPVVIKFIPPLAAWSAVLYVLHDVVLWLVTLF